MVVKSLELLKERRIVEIPRARTKYRVIKMSSALQLCKLSLNHDFPVAENGLANFNNTLKWDMDK